MMRGPSAFLTFGYKYLPTRLREGGVGGVGGGSAVRAGGSVEVEEILVWFQGLGCAVVGGCAKKTVCSATGLQVSC